MNNILAREFKFGSLIRFTLPTIIMMIFMSIYTMVDGIFVSNLVNDIALSAINIVWPVISIVCAIGIMFATGAGAIIAAKMGDKKAQEARQNFTLIITLGIAIGVVIMLVGRIFGAKLIPLLGGTELLYDYCYDYLTTLLLFSPLAILQMLFQFFFVTAGKPNLGLISTIGGGVANVVFDYLFIAVFDMGIKGAAIATGIGYSVPAVVGIVFFFINRKGSLYFVKPVFNGAMILDSCINGSSEMVTHLATAVTTFLFNMMTLKLLGEKGVAAITIVLYAQFLLSSLYLGFSSGIAPIFSFNFGEGNRLQIKKLFKMSIIFIAISSVMIIIIAFLLAESIVHIFAKSGSEVFEIAIQGFSLFSICYIFMGLNIFASSLFTSLANGKISALISFLRTFIFMVPALLILPNLIGVTGIWIAVPIAEMITFSIAICLLFKYRAKYSLWGKIE